MRTALFVLCLCAASVAAAATPPVPNILGRTTGPGPMYPNPAISVVPEAPKVEDFPYVTEEYYVEGIAKDAPYRTRIIVRRPTDPSTFSGVVVAEALHAACGAGDDSDDGHAASVRDARLRQSIRPASRAIRTAWTRLLALSLRVALLR